MLGYGALGEFALGEGPAQSSVVSQALIARITASSLLRVATTAQSAVLGRAFGISTASDAVAGKSALAAQATAKVRSQVPGGIAVPGRITASSRALALSSMKAAVQGVSVARAYLKAAQTDQSALRGLAKASSRAADTLTATAAVLGRITSAAELKAPGGAGISGRIGAQTSATMLLHMDIRNTPSRRALLLSSASAAASYWKGHS